MKGKEKLDETNTFRLRVPPQAGPLARGYRSQAVLWTDKVYDQAMDQGRAGDPGYFAGAGSRPTRLTAPNGEKVTKFARTASCSPCRKALQTRTRCPCTSES